ncbi:MAG: hypothetical protein PVSMB10_14510 [Pseudarthrobacter sp.]
MGDSLDSTAQREQEAIADEGAEVRHRAEPSNTVHARVGDTVLLAARDGVRRGLKPEDIIREIVTRHDVRLNLGELRLLLASRRFAAEEAKQP